MKRFKIIMALILVIIFCFSVNVYGEESPIPSEETDPIQDLEDEMVRYVNELQQRILDLEASLSEPETPTNPVPKTPVIMVVDPLLVEIEAGQTKTVEVTVKNLASDSAKDIITTVSTTNAGLAAVFTGNDGYISSLGNKSTKKVELKITADRSASDGYATINFAHSYLNSINEAEKYESAISVRVTNPNLSNTVVLKDIAVSSENIAPGSDFTLNADIMNEGTADVRDISVEVEGVESEGIYIKNATNVVSFNSVAPNASQSLSIHLSANEHMKRGSYPLTLNLSYYDADSETKQQSKSYTYYVNVSGGSGDLNAAEVIVTNITAPAETMGIAQEFAMKVTVQNISQNQAKNVKLSASPEGEGAVVPKSTSITQFNTLAPGEVREATFTFAATALSKSQNYVIGFTIDYENGLEDTEGNAETVSFTQYQGVNISNPEADEEEENGEDEDLQSVPKIIIKEYASDPIIVRAGTEFDLSMTFLNTSAEMTVKNIKVILTVEEGTEEKGSVFTPVNSSNTFYFDSIPAKGEVSQKIRMYAVPDASPKNYIINVKFEYEDMENNPHESLESVGINVKQITKLDTSEFMIDEFATVWQPIFVNFELYNTGKVTLSNLMIKIEGNFEASQKSMYYGSFAPSSTDYYDNQITPTEEGLQEGAIVITYEDDTGERIEQRKEFTVDVSPQPEMGMDGSVPPDTGMEGMVFDEETGMWVEADKGLPIYAWVGIGVAVLAAVVITVVVIRIKRKKQREMDFDE
ncbi:MAG: hypothetical protein LBU94_04515 [Clostridiales bacterium]|nr:hypothetical protein [Clostridiales bacterium]